MVGFLFSGAGVVTTRAHVHYMITEYGIAHLFGKNLRQRAYELIRIAHPDHRENLEKAAFDRLKVMPSPWFKCSGFIFSQDWFIISIDVCILFLWAVTLQVLYLAISFNELVSKLCQWDCGCPYRHFDYTKSIFAQDILKTKDTNHQNTPRKLIPHIFLWNAVNVIFKVKVVQWPVKVVVLLWLHLFPLRRCSTFVDLKGGQLPIYLPHNVNGLVGQLVPWVRLEFKPSQLWVEHVSRFSQRNVDK